MSNDLIPIDFNQLPSTSIGSKEIYDDLAKGGEFLGRLQLFGKGKYVDKGLVRPGHFGIPISAEEVIDLGKSIDVIPLARRPKALDMSDKPVIAVYDENDPEFKRIRDRSAVKNSQCQFGPSFLVVERTTGRLLEYFLGAPTHRPEAKRIYPFLPLTANDIARAVAAGEETDTEPHGARSLTLTSKYIEKEFSWYVPVVTECSTPFKTLPKMTLIQEEILKFLTAKTEVEVAPEEPASKPKRAR